MTPSSLVKIACRYLTGPRPQKQSPDPYIEAMSRSVVVDGAEHVVSYGDPSQHNRDGTGASACGLAALNFARIVFSIEQSGLQDTALLQAVLAPACAEETTTICTLWSGDRHLEVEEICRTPLFEKTLKIKTTTYGHPGASEFESLLTELSNLDSSAVVIITRLPESIACLKLRLATRNVFIIFESYPNGVGMIVSPSIEGIAYRLTELLPTVNLPDSFRYSGHIFVPNGVETSTPTLWQAVLESSLTQLSMQGEIAELRSQNEFLKSEQQRVESETKEAEARSREQEATQRLFECGICMEEMPGDSITRPDPCGHTFCRECLRGHVAARLNEHRFPILCPTCTAGKGKGKEAAGEVSQSLALDLGLTEEQYSIWTEMELVSFAVLLYCRKCQRTMFVARDEHEEAKIIACPLPDCNHAWCKHCQQSIDSNGPKHSCDGTLELDHLMKEQGWKYCPTCKTPIQKISGCNHVLCKTPGCNTHFCYTCGGLIVKGRCECR